MQHCISAKPATSESDENSDTVVKIAALVSTLPPLLLFAVESSISACPVDDDDVTAVQFADDTKRS